MDKKKKTMLIVALIVATGGILWYLNKKRKEQQGGQEVGGADASQPNAKLNKALNDANKPCVGVKEALGGGKGKYLAIDEKKGSKGRENATKTWKVGMVVSIDGGTPTEIIKLWKDTNKQVGAVKLKDGTANGKSMCAV